MSESSTWWMVTKYCDAPIPVKVVGETEHMINIELPSPFDGKTTVRRSAKISSYERYFATWEDAVAHMICINQKDFESARTRAQDALRRIANINALVKPKEAK